jgi:sialic acid synthase SpsE
MLGDGVKIVQPKELTGFCWKMGKAIHPARTITAGKVIERSDITIKAPADGMPPSMLDYVVGKVALFDLSTADTMEERHIGWPV